MNVAIGLARLGQPTEFVGRLSAIRSDGAARHLERSAVGLQHVGRPPTRARSRWWNSRRPGAVPVLARGGLSVAGRELAFLPGGARACILVRSASWLPPGDAAIAAAVDRVRRERLGPHQLRPERAAGAAARPAAARRQVEQSVSLAHIVKASSDDLAWLYGPEAADAVARRWLDLGASLVVITAGADGATGWTPQQPPVSRAVLPGRWSTPLAPVTPLRAGCSTRWPGATCSRRPALPPWAIRRHLAAVLDDASRIAGVTCSRAGANPPTRRAGRAGAADCG